MKVILSVLLCTLLCYGKAQLFYNKGQTVFSDTGAIIVVQGSLKNDSAGNINHNGYIEIDSSFINQKGITQGNGIYDVYADWINNASFIRDTSHVYLKGGNELITGDSITSYYNLTLAGTGIKKMAISSKVYKFLNLNNLELAAQQDTMFVMNDALHAVLYDSTFGAEGFVSNLDTGALVRYTNQNNGYVYPMGSTLGTTRFRKINMTPDNSTAGIYVVSFYNRNATLDNYNVANKDTNVCAINKFYYHKISRLNVGPSADVQYFYAPSDGIFDIIANWESGLTKWSDIHNFTASTGNYLSLTRHNWNSYANLPYALGEYKPTANLSGPPSLVCKFAALNFTTPASSLLSYNWYTPAGTITTGTNTNAISATFPTSGTYTLGVVITNTITGCTSALDVYTVTISSGPHANFTYMHPAIVNNPIQFQDSSVNTSGLNWDFGNTYTDTHSNPQSIYTSLGNYPVTLIVHDSLGCLDTIVKYIEIDGSISVPNIFTPNGDGANDVFLLKNLGLNEYAIEIVDRWGLVVYNGDQNTSAWDGRTPAGLACPAGTYFYLIQGTAVTTPKEYKGFLTLIR